MISCRKAEESDIERLVQLTQEIVENEDFDRFSIYTHTDIKQTIVICKNDIIIGLVVVNHFSNSDHEFYKDKGKLSIGKSIYLSSMGVDLNYMKKGYGSILMKYIIEETKGFKLFCDIEINPERNDASLNFFNKLGFKNESEFKYTNDSNVDKEYAFYSFENF